MLPQMFQGLNKGAAIKVSKNGKFLYASNRGHDSVAVYEVIENGRLKLTGICSVHGSAPRDVELIDDMLICANQDSNVLTVLRIGEDGMIMQCENAYGVIRPVYVMSC